MDITIDDFRSLARDNQAELKNEILRQIEVALRNSRIPRGILRIEFRII